MGWDILHLWRYGPIDIVKLYIQILREEFHRQGYPTCAHGPSHHEQHNIAPRRVLDIIFARMSACRSSRYGSEVQLTQTSELHHLQHIYSSPLCRS